MIKKLQSQEKEQTPEQIRDIAFKKAYRKIIKYAKDNGIKSVIYSKEYLEQNITIAQQNKVLTNDELLKAYEYAIETINYNLKNKK
jgi:hypothetical protein